MTPDEPADRFGFYLAQNWKLLGHVLDRAVVLAHLYAERRVMHGRRVPVVGERGRQCRRSLVERQRRDPFGVPRFPLRHPATSEVLNGGVSRRFPQVAQRVDGHVVVRRRAGRMTGIGQREALGRPPPPPRAVAALFPSDDQTVGERGVQVPADRRRGEPEPVGELGRGGRPELQQEPHHPITGALVSGIEALQLSVTHGFHNAIIA